MSNKEMKLHFLVTKIFGGLKEVSEHAPTRWYSEMDGLAHLNVNYVDVRVEVEDLKKLQELLEEYKKS